MPKTHTEARHPHAGGCDGCREARICNACGDPITTANRCTNGRCHDCHVGICTPGGETYPGHGYGTPERAVAFVMAGITRRPAKEGVR